MTVFLRVAYDGTDFHGYARQLRDGVDSVRTVQAVLELALARLYGQPVPTRAASRTDAGVHARGQLVACDPPFAIVPVGLARGLNALLPADAVVTAAWDQPGEAKGANDPRTANLGKHYRYSIRCGRTRDPSQRRFEWNLGRALSVVEMRRAARDLLGTHDYTSFRAVDCQAHSTVRTLTRIDVEADRDVVGPAHDEGRARISERDDVVRIDVEGTAFLKNMVRIIVGTLVEVGLGRRDASSMPLVLAANDRRRAGMTAPPGGLTLVEVLWPRTEVRSGSPDE